MTRKMKLFDYLNYLLMAFFCFIAIYPILFVIAGSFSDGQDYLRGGIYFLPRKFSLSNYIVVFMDKRMSIGFRNTIARTFLGTAASVLFTAMVSYAMSRKNLKGRNFYYWFSIFTLFFGGGLIPYFLLLKFAGLINTFWVYIIPLLYSVFNMIILQNFFREIPEEIHESAVIDGAREFVIFTRLILPLSLPALATIALWTAVGHWNSFFDSMLFTTNPELSTLQLFLIRVIREASAASESSALVPPQVRATSSLQTVKLAAISVTTLPIMLVYPFLQRYFITGLMVGSVKG